MTGVEPEIAAQDTLSCALGSVHDLLPAPMTSTGFAGALARAHGYAAYAHFRERYRAMAASLGFEGHMKWAEAMP
jgi:hypothetical protein